jgi:DtxR family Mn-dependent transcriptional regulator
VSSDLIDTTEMYLRTIYELVEEGIVPLRARIAERLGQSGPTVSQTVARMERDGLLTVEGDRHLELTKTGQEQATRVMRKHRLAERLLVDVIGLAWEDVHVEACRWEHVISEAVERRLLEILDHPTESPFGNPIPGLVELDAAAPAEHAFLEADLTSLREVMERGPRGVGAPDAAQGPGQNLVIRRLGEPLQTDPELMLRLRRAGVRPGSTVRATVSPGGGVLLGSVGETAELDLELAAHVFVTARAA